MKKCVVVGCSYASDWATHIGLPRFTIWPELLAEHFNLELVNLSRPGASNKEIVSKALDAVVKYKDMEALFVMWTEFDRISFQSDQPWWKSFSAETSLREKVECFPGCQEISKVMLENDCVQLQAMVDDTIRTMYTFQTVMEHLDINYIHMQGPSPNPFFDYSVYDFSKAITKAPHFDLIQESKLLGWPCTRNIAGWNMDDFFRFHVKDDNLKFEDCTIDGENDAHPNRLGNQYIFHIMKNQYEQTYS